jgi:hypothetical protein
MKKFIVSVLGVTVFCIGLGALADQAGATFKSDEKAVALIKQARLAIGGEQSIAEVQSMIVKGNTTVTFKVDGAARTEQGETEIAMQLPDKLSRRIKLGRHDAGNGEAIAEQKHDVVILRSEANGEGAAMGEGGKRVFVRKIDGKGGDPEVEKIIVEGKEGEFTTSDGKKVVIRQRVGEGDVKDFRVEGSGDKVRRVKVEELAPGAHGAPRQNELLRVTLGLLATPPAGMDVNYTYAGERDVDGTTCNVVNAEFGGSAVTLYLAKTTSLPVMVSYQGRAIPTVMRFHAAKAPADGEPREKVIFDHKIPAPELAEIQVRYSDYRSVNGVQLPYKWTTSMGGQTSEVFDVTSYEINPANIAEKFKHEKVLVRTKKEAN